MILFGAQGCGTNTNVCRFSSTFMCHVFVSGWIPRELSKDFKDVLLVSFIYIVWTAGLGLERMRVVQGGESFLSLWTNAYFLFYSST